MAAQDCASGHTRCRRRLIPTRLQRIIGAMSDKKPQDHTLLVFCLAVFLFHSPLTNWWSGLQLPWYGIFVAWGAVIALVIVNQLRQPRA